jgi:hypothetical protein
MKSYYKFVLRDGKFVAVSMCCVSALGFVCSVYDCFFPCGMEYGFPRRSLLRGNLCDCSVRIQIRFVDTAKIFPGRVRQYWHPGVLKQQTVPQPHDAGVACQRFQSGECLYGADPEAARPRHDRRRGPQHRPGAVEGPRRRGAGDPSGQCADHPRDGVRASDIHIAAPDHRLHLRTRIDGMLHDQEPPPLRLNSAIVSRVKIMARLNIAERRLPRDGRVRLNVFGALRRAPPLAHSAGWVRERHAVV